MPGPHAAPRLFAGTRVCTWVCINAGLGTAAVLKAALMAASLPPEGGCSVRARRLLRIAEIAARAKNACGGAVAPVRRQAGPTRSCVAPPRAARFAPPRAAVRRARRKRAAPRRAAAGATRRAYGARRRHQLRLRSSGAPRRRACAARDGNTHRRARQAEARRHVPHAPARRHRCEGWLRH